MNYTGVIRRNLGEVIVNYSGLFLLNMLELGRIRASIISFECSNFMKANPERSGKFQKLSSEIPVLQRLLNKGTGRSSFGNIAQLNSIFLTTKLATTRVLSEFFRVKSINPDSQTYEEKLMSELYSTLSAGILSSIVFIPLESFRIRYNILNLIENKPQTSFDVAKGIYQSIKAKGQG